MKNIGRILKRAGAGVAALLLVAVAVVVVKFYVLSPRSRPAEALTAPKTPEAIERGRYLVENVAGCTGCHSPIREDRPGDPPVEGRIGAGRDFGGAPDAAVHIRGSNITPDPTTGLGAWTDGEIVRAIREGVSKDGRTLFPQMPYHTYGRHLGNGEVLDIVAYLRTLAPITNDPGRTSVGFPVSMFIRGVPEPVEAPTPAPSPSDKLARGEWLLQVAACHECHDSVDGRRQKIDGKALGGGFKFSLGARGYAIAPNISSDTATGIGTYADADILRAIEEGKGKDGRDLYSMPWTFYRGMTKEDKDDLIAALRRAPAVVNVVAPSQITR